jgi:hypothetical protein
MSASRDTVAAPGRAARGIGLSRVTLRRWALLLSASLALLLSVIGANALALHNRGRALDRLDVGYWGDQHLLAGVFEQETDGAGATYRWTSNRAVFRVRDYAAVGNGLLRIEIGGLPPGADSRLVQLQLDRTALTLPMQAAARSYHLVLPAGALSDGDLDVTLAGATSQAAPDPRDLGVRLDDLALGWAGGWALPTWPTLLVQWATVLVWLGIGRRLGMPRWGLLGVALGAVALLAAMAGMLLLMVMAWQTRLLATSVILLGLAWNALPLLQKHAPALRDLREIRWLLAIVAIALGVRLIATFYPPWGSHDLYIHDDRLRQVQHGALQLWDRPSEFAGQRTIVQPAFYLFASPLTLLTRESDVAIQGVYTLLEGTSALLAAILVRQIGGGARAARIAAIAIAALPIQLTALWWGFGPQIVGQWLLLLLATLITRPTAQTRAFWISAGFVFCLALLMHNGVAALGGVWLAGYAALIWWNRRSSGQWKRWALLIGASGAVAVALLYADVIVLQWQGLVGGASAPQRFENSFRILLIGRGLLSSLRPLDIGLSLASLAALLLMTRAQHRWLVAAWLASALLFLGVDVLVGLQVRYAYFAVPLVCAGLGMLLDRFSRAGRWGRAASWSIVGMIVWAGLALWLPGIFEGLKPTLTALTH